MTTDTPTADNGPADYIGCVVPASVLAGLLNMIDSSGVTSSIFARSGAKETARIALADALEHGVQTCTCTPLPDTEGPCSWCDVHGQPSVAWDQGVAEGRHNERVIANLEIRDLGNARNELVKELVADRDRLSGLVDLLDRGLRCVVADDDQRPSDVELTQVLNAIIAAWPDRSEAAPVPVSDQAPADWCPECSEGDEPGRCEPGTCPGRPYPESASVSDQPTIAERARAMGIKPRDDEVDLATERPLSVPDRPGPTPAAPDEEVVEQCARAAWSAHNPDLIESVWSTPAAEPARQWFRRVARAVLASAPATASPVERAGDETGRRWCPKYDTCADPEFCLQSGDCDRARMVAPALNDEGTRNDRPTR